MNRLILIVDDDRKIASLIDFHLQKKGYAASCAYRGEEALESLKEHRPLLVMLDIRLPDMSGVEVLKEIKKRCPRTHVIMISAHADVKMAVDCMKFGAYDLVEKPLVFPELDAKVEHVFNQFDLEEEVLTLKKELGEKYKFKTMIGKSPSMKRIFDGIELAAKSDANVLIEGESGTGKELVARAIHFNGTQKEGPFVAVNCAAIPENLLESELFGHEKGAFTGALVRRIGKFEQAQGGTLFLDEIGDLPLALQAKLLRVLQEREIERLGGSSPISLFSRFILATNKNLRRLVQEKKFRDDLYFRINVFPVSLPPLRERKEDVPELLMYFIQKYQGKKFSFKIEPPALTALTNYPWPGNIRELENFVQRLMLVKRDSEVIREEDVLVLFEGPQRFEAPPDDDGENGRSRSGVMGKAEKNFIEEALRRSKGNISEASRLIHISRDTFYRKMKKYSLQR